MSSEKKRLLDVISDMYLFILNKCHNCDVEAEALLDRAEYVIEDATSDRSKKVI